MNINRIRKSIVTKLICFGVLIALITSGARYFLLTSFLREDLEKVVSAQQASIADYVAKDIDFKISQRQRLLGAMVSALPIEILQHPGMLSNWLEANRHPELQFFQNLFVLDKTGNVVASGLKSQEVIGKGFVQTDLFLAEDKGRSFIGRPYAEVGFNTATIPFAEQIRDKQGKILGVLIGTTRTSTPGFLDVFQNSRIGKTGGFLLISKRDQVFVATTNSELTLKSTAAPGINQLHDQALKGWQGSGVTINAQGDEEIVAVAIVQSADWFVVARITTAEAFSTIGRTQTHILRNTMIIIGIFLVILIVLLGYIFRPLARAARQAELMTLGKRPLAPLKVQNLDEVGHLTIAFNRLLEKLLLTQTELEKAAHHDTLTGLPNRLLLADRLRQTLLRSKRNERRLAVLYLDLDGFKPINDKFGHDGGDQALIQVVQRLSATVREGDTLARVGGDEFVMVVGELDASYLIALNAACSVAQKCIDATNGAINIKGEHAYFGVSVGVVVGDVESSPESLLSKADQAMYAAKNSGRGRYVVANFE